MNNQIHWKDKSIRRLSPVSESRKENAGFLFPGSDHGGERLIVLKDFDLITWLLFRASLVHKRDRINTIYRLTESLSLPEHKAQKVRRWAVAVTVAYGDEKADLYE